MGLKNIYERFIWFDDRVRKAKYPNATTLAERFEISSKTAQRDIDFMRDRLRCPLNYDASRKGYYYEDDTFSLPMVYLSSTELSTLLIARKMLQDLSGGCIGKEMASLADKITNVLHRHMTTGNHVDDAVSFQLIGYSPSPDAVFKAALEACLKRKRLSFTYSSPATEQTTTRTVDPYHLFSYMGTWHLIAYCHLRDHIRDFALARITEAKVLPEAFDLPDHFDVKEYFRSSFGIYKGKGREEVTLRFSAEKSKWIRDQIWHKDQTARFLKDGSMELTFQVADFSEIKMEILRHGDQVEVVKPESLRTLVGTEASNIARMYDGNGKRRAAEREAVRDSRRSQMRTSPSHEPDLEAVPV